jgi:hypothetical protein
MSLAENVDKVHEELIEQEGIKLVDLPKTIKAKIKGWNLLFAKLKKSEDETLFRSVQRKSIELADKIQDFIETDYQDESNVIEPTPESKDEVKPESKDEVKPEAKTESKTESKEPTKVSSGKSSFGNLVMEKKVLAKLKSNGNGRIRIGELKSIISKEPDYPEQKVNKITLRKVFMSSEYRLK